MIWIAAAVGFALGFLCAALMAAGGNADDNMGIDT